MIDGKKVLAIIPARGGSKRLPMREFAYIEDLTISRQMLPEANTVLKKHYCNKKLKDCIKTAEELYLKQKYEFQGVQGCIRV